MINNAYTSMINRSLLMNQNQESNTATLTVDVSPAELSHLEEYRKLNSNEKENVDRIIEMCLKSKEMK